MPRVLTILRCAITSPFLPGLDVDAGESMPLSVLGKDASSEADAAATVGGQVSSDLADGALKAADRVAWARTC
jgi:hypothetical protein